MRNIMKRIVPFFALALLALGTTNNAQAACTLANTNVDNLATMDFKVGGFTQTSVYSTGNSGVAGPSGGTYTRFVVDRKINLTVAKTGSIVDVAPGQTGAYLTYTVKNEGNAAQDFALSYSALANGTADPFGGAENDSFDAPAVIIRVESGATALYQAGEDTATNIINLAPDATATVYIIQTTALQSTLVDKQLAVYALIATAKEANSAAATAVTETAGADTVLTMDTVFADVAAGTDDAARDAAHSARHAFKVKAPVLTMAKASVVISDPVNGTTNPKAIPGAVVEYTVTITNNAAATGNATNVSISDSLAAMVGAGYISYNAGTLNITTPILNGGSNKALSDIADTDEGQVVGNVVTVGTTGTAITLAPGESAVIKYRVTITAA